MNDFSFTDDFEKRTTRTRSAAELQKYSFPENVAEITRFMRYVESRDPVRLSFVFQRLPHVAPLFIEGDLERLAVSFMGKFISLNKAMKGLCLDCLSILLDKTLLNCTFIRNEVFPFFLKAVLSTSRDINDNFSRLFDSIVPFLSVNVIPILQKLLYSCTDILKPSGYRLFVLQIYPAVIINRLFSNDSFDQIVTILESFSTHNDYEYRKAAYRALKSFVSHCDETDGQALLDRLMVLLCAGCEDEDHEVQTTAFSTLMAFVPILRKQFSGKIFTVFSSFANMQPVSMKDDILDDLFLDQNFNIRSAETVRKQALSLKNLPLLWKYHFHTLSDADKTTIIEFVLTQASLKPIQKEIVTATLELLPFFFRVFTHSFVKKPSLDHRFNRFVGVLKEIIRLAETIDLDTLQLCNSVFSCICQNTKHVSVVVEHLLPLYDDLMRSLPRDLCYVFLPSLSVCLRASVHPKSGYFAENIIVMIVELLQHIFGTLVFHREHSVFLIEVSSVLLLFPPDVIYSVLLPKILLRYLDHDLLLSHVMYKNIAVLMRKVFELSPSLQHRVDFASFLLGRLCYNNDMRYSQELLWLNICDELLMNLTSVFKVHFKDGLIAFMIRRKDAVGLLCFFVQNIAFECGVLLLDISSPLIKDFNIVLSSAPPAVAEEASHLIRFFAGDVVDHKLNALKESFLHSLEHVPPTFHSNSLSSSSSQSKMKMRFTGAKGTVRKKPIEQQAMRRNGSKPKLKRSQSISHGNLARRAMGSDRKRKLKKQGSKLF
ncbi:hypothetical protein PCE1_002959 [Barthelona sp. PCE]